MKDLDRAIEELAAKITQYTDADDALKLSQAILNLENTKALRGR